MERTVTGDVVGAERRRRPGPEEGAGIAAFSRPGSGRRARQRCRRADPAVVGSGSTGLTVGAAWVEAMDLSAQVAAAAPVGYDPGFLAVSVPLPTPVDGRVVRELGYEHFTVLLDPARRLAAAAGVNIDGDPETEGGEGASPGRAGKAAEVVGSVSESIAAIGECLIAGAEVKTAEVADEVAKITNIGAVRSPVLAAKVQYLVERHRRKVERHLLKIDGNDVAGAWQGVEAQSAQQGADRAWSGAGGLQGVARRLGGRAQELR